MNEAQRTLLDLIGSVADGSAVDWQRELDAVTDPRERQLIQSLYLVGKLGTLAAETTPRNPLPPGRYGHLELRERLASGAHADVYLAHDHRLQRDVALKLLAPDAGRWRGGGADQGAFLDEARRLARVRHPHVAVLYDLETIDGRPALVVEYLPGSTLAELVAREGPFGAGELIALAGQLCAALAAVHAAGLVHQDVKAQNVMRETGGRVVLMDFGSGGVTPLYMAPELFEGVAPSAASDLYALGVLLFHLATADFPVDAASLDALRDAHANGRRRRLLDLRPQFPPRLAALLDRAVAAAPEQRFRTAGEFAQALAELERPAPEKASRASAGRRLFPWLAGATLLLAGLAFGWRARTAREAPSSAPPTLAAESFAIEAAFYRGDRRQQRLAEGATVAVGDSISLSISTSDSLHLYVINQDESGAAYVLFPAPRFEAQNPLPPRADLRLPGRMNAQPFYWQITSDGGREHLLVLASRRRLRALEGDLLQLERPAANAPLEFRPVPEQFFDELRGMGGYAAGSEALAAPASTAQLLALASPLREGREQAQGVWIRKLTLVHAR